MSISILSTVAKEGSTYIITCAFTDEDGDPMTPVSMTWTLTDSAGTVINSRQDVAITPLSTSVNVVLYGDDLALSGSAQAVRVFTLEGTYNSTLGLGLPFKDAIKFNLDDLPGVL